MSSTAKISDEQRGIVSQLHLQGLGHEMSLAGSQLFSAKLLLLVGEVFPAVRTTPWLILCFATHNP